jgi:putative DNA primase/helicase
MTFDELISHFDVQQEEPDGWLSICPTHADSNPSLKLTIKDDGTALIACRAGCTNSGIITALGLRKADLFGITGAPVTSGKAHQESAGEASRSLILAQAYGWATMLSAGAGRGAEVARDTYGVEGLSAEQAHELGIGLDGDVLTFLARTEGGQAAFYQTRSVDPNCPKDKRWKTAPNPADGRWDGAGFVGKRTGNRPVIICEGLSDAMAVAALDAFDVVAVRGANQGARVTEVAGAFGDQPVYVAGDNDDAGRAMNAKVSKALHRRVRALRIPDGYKDLGDVRKAAPASFRAVLEDMTATAEEVDGEPDIEYSAASVRDVHIGARVAAEYLSGAFVAWGRSAWSRWDGKRWDKCSEAAVFEQIRRAILTIHREESDTARTAHGSAIARLPELDEEAQKRATKEANDTLTSRMKELASLLNVGKLQAILRIARGLIEVDQREFDNRPDLLNVANGVLDFKSGQLRAHDTKLMFTKVSPTAYQPDATHADWDKALSALPPDVADWMQLRFGQAATGYAAPDDVVPFLKGGGANGKSSVLAGILGALGKGEFATPVPEKALLGGANDHPTEMMPLKGARFAYIEELPEGDYLNAQRLKRVAGTEVITARYIGQDNVSWTATHSLMVTTNYDVKIDAVDHGTWRRLALVRFPFTYNGSDPERPKDPTLRDRIQRGDSGQHEAALRWLVDGAKTWYAAERVLPAPPEAVRQDTAEWKGEANQAIRFLNEKYEPDPNGAVLASEMFGSFKEWAEDLGMRKWGDQTFWSRARQHDWFLQGVVQKQTGSTRVAAWTVHAANVHALGRHARLVTGIRPAGAQPDLPGIFAPDM